MSKSNSSSSSGGIGFCGLLAIVFITLKLLGKIDWSWWWVLSPLWIGLAVVLFIAVVFFGGVAIAAGVDVARRRRRRRAIAANVRR
jgi:hypothetical protein